MTAIGLLGLALQASYQRGLVPAVLVSAALAPLMNAKQATESDAESQLQAAERLHVASSSGTSKLELPCCDKSFDAKSIYGAGEAALDMDHPNRIDQYGSLFQDDEFSSHPGLLSKVKKLKNSLIRLARLQRHLASQLDKPVQVSETVLPGAPGRMGRRGRRGPVGRRGKPGMTGAQVLSLCCTPLTCYTALDNSSYPFSGSSRSGRETWIAWKRGESRAGWAPWLHGVPWQAGCSRQVLTTVTANSMLMLVFNIF